MHPSLWLYHGQDKDFEDMACGEHSLTNEELIGFGEPRTVFCRCRRDRAFNVSRYCRVETLADMRCHETVESSLRQVDKLIGNIRAD